MTEPEAVRTARARVARGADAHATSVKSLRLVLEAYDDLQRREQSLRALCLEYEEGEEATGPEARAQVKALLPSMFGAPLARVRTARAETGCWQIIGDFSPFVLLFAEAPPGTLSAAPIEALALSLAAMLDCEYDVTATADVIEKDDRATPQPPTRGVR